MAACLFTAGRAEHWFWFLIVCVDHKLKRAPEMKMQEDCDFDLTYI